MSVMSRTTISLVPFSVARTRHLRVAEQKAVGVGFEDGDATALADGVWVVALGEPTAPVGVFADPQADKSSTVAQSAARFISCLAALTGALPVCY